MCCYYDARRLVAQDVIACDDHRSDCAVAPEVDIGSAECIAMSAIFTNFFRYLSEGGRIGVSNIPAYTSALDCDGDFARLESFALLDSFQAWLSARHPEIVVRVGPHPDVGLGGLHLFCFGHGGHGCEHKCLEGLERYWNANFERCSAWS